MTYAPAPTLNASSRFGNAVLLIILGIGLGLAAANVNLPSGYAAQATGEMSAIPGEDWHGNVRRSNR